MEKGTFSNVPFSRRLLGLPLGLLADPRVGFQRVGCASILARRNRQHGCPRGMSDVTLILSQIESGDPSAAEQLLPLVYDELRKLAAVRLADEKPGQTLQATALVHDAYIRLVDVKKAQHWNSRGHFFAAAAEAMRRILIEQARRKGRERHGGQLERSEQDLDLFPEAEIADPLMVL